MSCEALQLQQIMESRQRQAHILAVASGKGGAGKTHIAANSALCMKAAKGFLKKLLTGSFKVRRKTVDKK